MRCLFCFQGTSFLPLRHIGRAVGVGHKKPPRPSPGGSEGIDMTSAHLVYWGCESKYTIWCVRMSLAFQPSGWRHFVLSRSSVIEYRRRAEWLACIHRLYHDVRWQSGCTRMRLDGYHREESRHDQEIIPPLSWLNSARIAENPARF